MTLVDTDKLFAALQNALGEKNEKHGEITEMKGNL